jgi:hypothetical protein
VLAVSASMIKFGSGHQVGVEAIIPIDAHSGRDLGVRAQAHLYLHAPRASRGFWSGVWSDTSTNSATGYI